MPADEHRRLLAGVRTTGLWTLASRVLGMLRDMLTAALLGASGSAAADAFVVAFRIPNLFRRLFGEGALSASYLPVFTAVLDDDRRGAWRLASVVMGLLSAATLALVVVGELVLLGLWLAWRRDGDPATMLLIGLSAAMLPYVFFICVAAQFSATLHALGEFRWPAITPLSLNIVWIAGALLVAPRFNSQAEQAYVLAACVVIGGALQLGLQWPVLRAYSFRFDYNWPAARDGCRMIARNMLPMLLGLAVEQINTLIGSFIAWAFSRAADRPSTIPWLAWFGRGDWQYPMEQGAAASLYFAARLYQFPVGILGVAVATVIFPLLARHASRRQWELVGPDLGLGLRLVIFLAVPAGAGLMLLAEPLTALLFERGEFTQRDTARTARLVACYAAGVWAFCALPVLVRGFYALDDRRTPVRVGMIAVGVNLVLNLLLIWPLAEAGLATASVVATVVQLLALLALLARCHALPWRALAATLARALVSSGIMLACGWTVLAALPTMGETSGELFRVAVPMAVCLVVYLGIYRALGGEELQLLWNRR